jgi:hypothetical protein
MAAAAAFNLQSTTRILLLRSFVGAWGLRPGLMFAYNIRIRYYFPSDRDDTSLRLSKGDEGEQPPPTNTPPLLAWQR